MADQKQQEKIIRPELRAEAGAEKNNQSEMSDLKQDQLFQKAFVEELVKYIQDKEKSAGELPKEKPAGDLNTLTKEKKEQIQNAWQALAEPEKNQIIINAAEKFGQKYPEQAKIYPMSKMVEHKNRLNNVMGRVEQDQKDSAEKIAAIREKLELPNRKDESIDRYADIMEDLSLKAEQVEAQINKEIKDTDYGQMVESFLQREYGESHLEKTKDQVGGKELPGTKMEQGVKKPVAEEKTPAVKDVVNESIKTAEDENGPMNVPETIKIKKSEETAETIKHQEQAAKEKGQEIKPEQETSNSAEAMLQTLQSSELIGQVESLATVLQGKTEIIPAGAVAYMEESAKTLKNMQTKDANIEIINNAVLGIAGVIKHINEKSAAALYEESGKNEVLMDVVKGLDQVEENSQNLADEIDIPETKGFLSYLAKQSRDKLENIVDTIEEQ